MKRTSDHLHGMNRKIGALGVLFLLLLVPLGKSTPTAVVDSIRQVDAVATVARAASRLN